MAQMTIKIKNIDDIKRAFSEAPQIMNREMKIALTRSAITVQGQSMMNTPVLTGRLRSSHVFTVSGEGIGMRAEVYPTAEYGIFVHEGLGSNRLKGRRPFLEDALTQSTKDIQYDFTKAAQNTFDKIGRQV